MMAATSDRTMTVFGATGFLGRHVVRHLRAFGAPGSDAALSFADPAAGPVAERQRGVEFIDENGGGPGVRLRKPAKPKR
jgi:uncharacterized protein YbjT (DUF2867 family)